MRFWWESMVHVRHEGNPYEVLVGDYGAGET